MESEPKVVAEGAMAGSDIPCRDTSLDSSADGTIEKTRPAFVMENLPVITTSYIMSKYTPTTAPSVDSGIGSGGSSRTESDSGQWRTSSQDNFTKRHKLHKKIFQGMSTRSDSDSRVPDSPCSRAPDSPCTTDSEAVKKEPENMQNVQSGSQKIFFPIGQHTLDLLGMPIEKMTKDLIVSKRAERLNLLDMNASMLPLSQHVPRLIKAPLEYTRLLKKAKKSNPVKSLRKNKFTFKNHSNFAQTSQGGPQRQPFEYSEQTAEGRLPLIAEDTISECIETSDSAQGGMETRKRRFFRTRNALEESGLLDITMKTARLIQENTLLQREIENLKKQTKSYVESIKISQDNSEIQSLGNSGAIPLIVPKQEPSVD